MDTIFTCLRKNQKPVSSHLSYKSVPFSNQALGKSKSNLQLNVQDYFSNTIKDGVRGKNHVTRNQCVDGLLVLLNQTIGTVVSVHPSHIEGFFFSVGQTFEGKAGLRRQVCFCVHLKADERNE